MSGKGKEHGAEGREHGAKGMENIWNKKPEENSK
jgi:hypothetical protein